MTGPCRTADLEVFPAGDGLSLVYTRDTGAAGFYRADVLRVLDSCRELRTVEEHVAHCLPGPGSGPRAAALRRDLLRLYAEGFLVGTDTLRASRARSPLEPLSTIVVPTRDRVPLLRRMITGYAENCARYGRRASFVVADDSPGQAAQSQSQAMLGPLARHLGADIRYAGLARKAAFISRLARTGGIPEDVLRFGCLPDPGSGVTIGANRNVLLLATAGERIFSADDDTVCRVAVPPGYRDGVELDSGGNPLELWFFADRGEALASVRYTEQDILACHGRYLAASPAAVLAGTGLAGTGLGGTGLGGTGLGGTGLTGTGLTGTGLGDGVPVSVGRCDPALLRRVGDAKARIRVTANGVVGDCGWDNPDFCLFQDGMTFARLTGSADGFLVALTTREMIQAVTRTTITARADPKFAMCTGLDNTELLPPFPPVGRAEEVAFGAILSACFDGVYAAHLPLLLQHDPAAAKRFTAEAMFSINLGSWLQSAIGRFDPGLAASPAIRLDRLGHFLIDLGRLPERAFDEFARLIAWTAMSGMIASLEARMDGPERPPDYWVTQARRFMATARRSALAPAQEWYAAAGGRALLQHRLEQFGQLLIWWPAIVSTARELRAAGDELARPVREVSHQA